MSDQYGFDARLAAHFEREHRHVPGDVFVAATMEKVRTARRRREFMRVGWRVAALGAAAVASPWLISGVEYLNAAVESSLKWTEGQSGAWILGGLAVAAVLAMRLRSRSRH